MKSRRKSDFLSSRVQYISLAQLSPNPQQPRRSFDEAALRELADSIRAYGILQPLTVRRTPGGYQLVAGERRMRAARMAGLREVPCLVAQVDEQDAGMLALIENLQRRDLDCFEEAAAIARLISRYGLSQEQAAEKLGKSQSAVANKLRLLRLSEPVRDSLRQAHLTERHARALLRLGGETEQLAGTGGDRRTQPERGPDGELHRAAAGAGTGHAAPEPPHLHHQGRAAVPQQHRPQPANDTPVRRGRRSGPPGYRQRDPADHSHPQAAGCPAVVTGGV